MTQLDASVIDPQSAVPLYLQIRQLLLQAITSGELLPHHRAPSERKLSELTGVSRMTVRQALQQLVGEGWLYTVPGKGTFVAADPKIEQNLQRLSGFTEEVQSQGFAPGSRLLTTEIVAADERAAEVFGIRPGSTLIRICRLRLANGVPVAVEKTHLVQKAFPGLDAVDLTDQSLYNVLQTRYATYPTRAVQVIEAECADEAEARLLDIEAAAPVLAMERITYGSDDRPIEFVRSKYRADRSRLRVELHVHPRSGSNTLKNLFDAPMESVPGEGVQQQDAGSGNNDPARDTVGEDSGE